MPSYFSHIRLFVTLCAVARQAPLSMEFSRQGYWSGLPCPPPGDLPNPGIEPASLTKLFPNSVKCCSILAQNLGAILYSSFFKVQNLSISKASWVYTYTQIMTASHDLHYHHRGLKVTIILSVYCNSFLLASLLLTLLPNNLFQGFQIASLKINHMFLFY